MNPFEDFHEDPDLQGVWQAFEWLHVPAFAGLLLGLGLFLGQAQYTSSSVALKRPVPQGGF